MAHPYSPLEFYYCDGYYHHNHFYDHEEPNQEGYDCNPNAMEIDSDNLMEDVKPAIDYSVSYCETTKQLIETELARLRILKKEFPNNQEFTKNLSNIYIDPIIEYCRPAHSPTINIEGYVKNDENNKKIKDQSKRSQANAFFVYRKYLSEYLLGMGLKFSMQNISLLAGILWHGEQNERKDEYKNLSNQIKRKYEDNLQSRNITRQDIDIKKNGGNAFMIYRARQDIDIKKNGGNAFMIYRADLKLKHDKMPMQELSSIASIFWRNESEDVKREYYEKSKKRKDEHNKRIASFYK